LLQHYRKRVISAAVGADAGRKIWFGGIVGAVAGYGFNRNAKIDISNE
jgi:hypothetical protein